MKNLADLHTHCVLSTHAFSTVFENLQFAKKAGLKYYGLSDHQYDDKGVGAHPFAFYNCDSLPRYYEGIVVLRGIELNIMDGHFDISNDILNKLDYCIASMHHYVYPNSHTYEENTENYIYACNQPFVKILGHIDADDYPCDYERIVKECKKTHTLIELNNNSLRPNGSRKGAYEIDKKILGYCKEYQVPVIIGSDAHICFDVGNASRIEKLLDECSFPDKLVLNYNEDLFKDYFDINNLK